jgi:hypothetical protein
LAPFELVASKVYQRSRLYAYLKGIGFKAQSGPQTSASSVEPSAFRPLDCDPAGAWIVIQREQFVIYCDLVLHAGCGIIDEIGDLPIRRPQVTR